MTDLQIQTTVLCGAGDDIVRIDSSPVTAYGEAGDDELSGGFFADRLYVGDGQDELNGGGGDDLLHGGYDGETDVLTGGSGAGTFYCEYYRQKFTFSKRSDKTSSSFSWTRKIDTKSNLQPVLTTTVETEDCTDVDTSEGDMARRVLVQ